MAMNASEQRANAYRIAATTMLDPRTVLAVLTGASARESTRVAVASAAEKLGIPLPAAPSKRRAKAPNP